MSDNKTLGKEVAELLNKLIPELQERQKEERKNLKEKPIKKANGGFISKPLYYDNYRIAPRPATKPSLKRCAKTKCSPAAPRFADCSLFSLLTNQLHNLLFWQGSF
jgi:hypothetical protein